MAPFRRRRAHSQKTEQVSPSPAIWMRVPRGGRRRAYPIHCLIVGITPTGCIQIEYERRWRTISRVIEPRNLFRSIDVDGRPVGPSLDEAVWL